jgi:hypothetical protein
MKERIKEIAEILQSEDIVESYGSGVIEKYYSLFTINTFQEAVEPLMKWLCENQNQHTTVIVTWNRAELVQRLQIHLNDDSIVD